jgi:hypothetical protein
MIRTSLLLICVATISMAQEKPADFVLDASKPYVYLQFDHVGPRKPLLQGEEPEGLWLRIVNNCRLPISVRSFGTTPDNPGVNIFDEVVPVGSEGVQIHSDLDMEDSRPKQAMKSPPRGYSSELYSAIQVLPGKDLLFSVPRNHVDRDWFMRVTFALDVSKSTVGAAPRTELDFFDDLIPRQSTRKISTTDHPK